MKTLTERAAKVLREIDEQLAIAKLATEGPWKFDERIACAAVYQSARSEEGNGLHDTDERNICHTSFDYFHDATVADNKAQEIKNLAFIAASRTGYPLALDCLKTAIEGLLEIGETGGYESHVFRQTIAALCEKWEAGK